ncbi:cytochrome C [Trichlorobacter ammonificans]|uniref:Cytochrome C n=1 Tax=Trichlorobacter ammonificans TaxID=2916410 RepID=A0ABM9D646_9BACT|nr:cytochrome C [Trichlorobacter ammonificans]CAH2030638.1 Cytochrome C [Trichlorobacter ammonificans]
MKAVTALAAVALFTLLSGLAQAQEVTWSKDIKAIFDKNCLACHDANMPEYARFKKEKDVWMKKGMAMRMDTYSHLVSFVGWPNAGALMRRLDDGSGSKDGKPGNMYAYLGANEEERQKNLQIFKNWVGNWNLKRWPDLTKEEVSGLKVKY